MRLDKKQLNKMLHQALGKQYSIEKLTNNLANKYHIEAGYHISFDTKIVTTKPLGANLVDANVGLKKWIFTKIKRPEKYTRYKIALDFLYATYPKCFVSLKEKKRYALAIGIKELVKKDIVDKLPIEISWRDILGALKLYFKSNKYRQIKSITGTPRVNLAGKIVGKVTEAEAKAQPFIKNKKQTFANA